MIETFFGNGAMGTPAAFLASLLIGVVFGAVLEQSGFGSSRRVAGIFYFRDMTVIKVMLSAIIVAMIGIGYAKTFGWVTMDNVYIVPTAYAAQIIGGLIFGVGFVMSGWCPGTGTVGLASGRIDALIFLVGVTGGSMIYNEVFPLLGAITERGQGVVLAYQSLGMTQAGFALLLTTIAIIFFWAAEYAENRNRNIGILWRSKFLKTYSALLIVGSIGLLAAMGQQPFTPPGASTLEATLLQGIHAGSDHISPQELADRLLAGDPSITLVDIRTPEEYAAFHIKTAINVQAEELPTSLSSYKNQGLLILYSNGMTHPAQARDSLFRLGYQNVWFLTDGLEGFIDTCLKPVSLRAAPVTEAMIPKIDAWRSYFLSPMVPLDGSQSVMASTSIVDANLLSLPGLVETDWLDINLERPGLKVIDLRSQPSYNSGHIPGSLSFNLESLRGIYKGVPSSLLPEDMLARHFSLMGIAPDDLVVLVSTNELRDATLAAMACERLGHRRYAILQGGYPKWQTENRPLDTRLPKTTPSQYAPQQDADTFTVGADQVMLAVGLPTGVILDVRPEAYFTGLKQDEARGGHIPGAINRPYDMDVMQVGDYSVFKPVTELAGIYEQLIPSKDAPVIVHCRTGHQASQTYFVLARLLGYTNVKWYDASWTEWAANPNLPVKKEVKMSSANDVRRPL